MIGWLCGKIIDKIPLNKLLLDVNHVGYEVEVPLSTYVQLIDINNMVSLYIHTVVREDAFLLYGFLTKNEQGLFRLLIKVNGVGPKVAIAILSSLSPQQFVDIIHQHQPGLLAKIPGIGKKTAERLMIEMKEPVNQLLLPSDPLGVSLKSNAEHEAISALEALGFKFAEASKAVRKLNDGEKSAQQLIKHALQVLT